MKTPIPKFLLLAAILCGQGIAQQVRTAPSATLATIPGPVRDSTPVEPPSPEEKPNFQIESTQVKLIDVVESPPMPELPPVAGTMTLTVHGVADPGLPAPEPIVEQPIIDADGQGVIEPVEEHHMAIVSATVYDHSRTLVSCHSSAGRASVTAWSNIDFNHFCGTGNFEATGADGETVTYSLMMGIGNENTAFQKEQYEKEGMEWLAPEIPEIPGGAPAFVLQTANPDPESLKLLEALHALFRDEGGKLAEAAAAKKRAEGERRAYLLAHPPKPKDVTVHFWKRNTEALEGGQP